MQLRSRLPHFRKFGHLHHQTGLLNRFERQLTRTCRGALQQETKLAESSLVRFQLQGRSMSVGRWRFAVLTQKHRWTRESVSDKAKSEKYLSTGHQGETERSPNEGRVLPFGKFVTLWRKVRVFLGTWMDGKDILFQLARVLSGHSSPVTGSSSSSGFGWSGQCSGHQHRFCEISSLGS